MSEVELALAFLSGRWTPSRRDHEPGDSPQSPHGEALNGEAPHGEALNGEQVAASPGSS